MGFSSAPWQPLTAGQEYELFHLSLGYKRTIPELLGASPCAGCSTHAAIVLRSLRLTQPPVAGGGCGAPVIARNGVYREADAGARARGDATLATSRREEGTVGMSAGSGDIILQRSSSSSGNVVYFNGTPSGFQITGIPPDALTTIRFGPPAPNPARGSVRMVFMLPREVTVSVGIYDLTGRRVRELRSGRLPAGEHDVMWDGRSERGEESPSGVYFCRLKADGRSLTRTLVRLH